MAIDIVTIKNGCRSIQATAAQYDTVITQLESARSTCKADEIDIDGATMGQKFEEIEELVKKYEFKSETDTERVCALIDSYYNYLF